MKFKQVAIMFVAINVFILIINIIFTLTKSPIVAISNESNQAIGTISAGKIITKKVRPDTVSIRIAVETTNIDAEKSANLNKTKSTNLINALKSMLNKKTDFIQTTNYSVYPEYKYIKNQRKLIGYKTKNEIKLKTQSIDKLGTIIDKATSSGANHISGINFSISTKENDCNEMLARASKEAKQKAKNIANSLNSEIKNIKQINFSCGAQNIRPLFRMEKSVLAGTDIASNSTPVQAGSIDLTADVNIDFYLK